jgi:hypothetical protein
MTALAIFFFFGAVAATAAGATLVFPGTALDRIWTLNPRAYRDLSPLGKAVGIAFLLLAVVLFIAGAGWLKRRLWGWRLAVAIFVIHVLADLVNVFRGLIVEGGVGVVISLALLLYLLRKDVRAVFEPKGSN